MNCFWKVKPMNDSFYGYAEEFLKRQPDYIPAKNRFHQVMADYMEMAVRRQILRLQVITPPQHGKSTFLALAASYELGMYPHHCVGWFAHAGRLTLRDSMSTQRAVSSDIFARRFGQFELLSKGQESWGLKWAGGLRQKSFVAAPIISGGTGQTLDLACCDDMLSGYNDAWSEANRDRAKNGFFSGVLTRGSKDYSIISIGTRWHESDVIGAWIESAKNSANAVPLTVLTIPYDSKATVWDSQSDQLRKVRL
jgi:hypothetical protein